MSFSWVNPLLQTTLSVITAPWAPTELLFYLDFESVEFADVGEAETVVPVRGRNKGCRLSNANRQRGVITMWVRNYYQ